MSTVSSRPPPLARGQRLTVDEFLRRWEAMPELKFAELIDGKVYLPSPLSTEHGLIDSRVGAWLVTYAAYTRGCDAGCQATWLMHHSAPQPDNYLWILSEHGGQSGVQGEYHSGAPELAAEICVSSAAYDLGAKKRLYLKAGVQEYVAVIVQTHEVRWHRLVDGAYQLRLAGARGVYRSELFPGLWLDSAALWKHDTARILATLQRGLKSAGHSAFVKALARRKRRQAGR
jgi:Uma2 family endonuclease